jgi:hypothetical protein
VSSARDGGFAVPGERFLKPYEFDVLSASVVDLRKPYPTIEDDINE